MRHLTLIVVVVVILVMSGMLVLALNLQARSRAAYATATYATPTGYSYYSGSEWDELREFQAQGSAGWAGLETMMSSTDPAIVREAATHLATSGGEAIDHYLRGLPTINVAAKNYIGIDDFGDHVWDRILEVVRNEETELLEGAAYFLRIENGDMHRTVHTEGEVGDALVASIPGASGVYAAVLPQTLGHYIPDDVSALTRLLSSNNENDRLIAVISLGKLGLEETQPDVRRLKTDSSKAVRSAAFTADTSIDDAVARAAAQAYAATMAGRLSSISVEETSSDPALEREKAKKRLGMP